MTQKQVLPFWFLTISVFCILILPALLKDGMFMDGLLYACVSKNLSQGIGSFWFPHFSKTLYSFFDQQPPLGFWIQSIFFKILGNSIYVERFYSFLTALITAFLIIILWRLVFKNQDEIKKLSWLPVLFWITIPVCFWAYSNNMLENTMGIFDLLAVICILRFFQRQSFLLIIISTIFIFLASLTKGFPGMFPITALLFGGLVYKNISFSKILVGSLILIFIPVLIYFILMQNDLIYQSITTYLTHRVLNSIINSSEVNSRFYMLPRLFLELLPPVILSVAVILIGRNKKENTITLFFKKHILFFLLIGISSSFPLMVTLKQSGFYLVASFPYYAICFAIATAPYLATIVEKINVQHVLFKISRIGSLLFLAGVLIFSFLQIGQTGRDENMIHDIHLVGKFVPSGTTLGSTKELWKEWPLQEYLVRHYYICQSDRSSSENDYLLLESETQIPADIKIEKINISTIKYHLYKVKR